MFHLAISFGDLRVLQLTLPCFQFLWKHITVKGVLIFSTEEFEEVMQWMSEGEKFKTQPALLVSTGHSHH